MELILAVLAIALNIFGNVRPILGFNGHVQPAPKFDLSSVENTMSQAVCESRKLKVDELKLKSLDESFSEQLRNKVRVRAIYSVYDKDHARFGLNLIFLSQSGSEEIEQVFIGTDVSRFSKFTPEVLDIVKSTGVNTIKNCIHVDSLPSQSIEVKWNSWGAGEEK